MSAVVDFPAKPEVAPYLDAFAAASRAKRRAGEPEWLAGSRRRGIARFAELGFPSRRSEAWRYLDLRPLEAKPMLPAVGAPAAAADPGLRDRMAELAFAGARYRIVLVDGVFAPVLSGFAAPPPGVWLGSFASAIVERPDLLRAALQGDALAAARPFAALNAAFAADGFVLEIGPAVVLDAPIEIIHLASGATSRSLHTRSQIVLGAHSRAALIETYAGPGSAGEAYWRNDVVELRLAPGALLQRTLLVDEAAEAVHLGETTAILEAGAELQSFSLLLGGGTVRQEASVALAGEGAQCRLDGAFVIDGREEANIVTNVEHRATRGETRELFKGVAAGRAHGAFQGRIIVREGAQKTDAHQTSRNLLIGSRASIDTKPELEIYADDVKCSHGATVGDLDEAALFYMQARGIPPVEARRLLIEAFVREAVERVGDAELRDHLLRRLTRRLNALEA